MSSKITAIVGKIVDELEGLTSDERKRAIAGALAILGESALQAGTFITPKGDAHPSADIHHAQLSGVSQGGQIWVKKNTLTNTQFEEVFHVENGKVTLILGKGIGKSKREQTINTYLLTGAATMLETGTPAFTDEMARQNCITIGCYDAPNHGKYFRGFSNKITGSKTAGWKLTAPGLTAAATLLKHEEPVNK